MWMVRTVFPSSGDIIANLHLCHVYRDSRPTFIGNRAALQVGEVSTGRTFRYFKIQILRINMGKVDVKF